MRHEELLDRVLGSRAAFYPMTKAPDCLAMLTELFPRLPRLYEVMLLRWAWEENANLGNLCFLPNPDPFSLLHCCCN
jgi:hypothetical protein